MPNDVKWVVQRGYSIESQLSTDGLSFDAFELIKNSTSSRTVEKVKSKIIGRLAKNLRSDCEEDHNIKIADIKYGCYCIGLGTGFEYDYTMRKSRILYIGSGAVYSRIKSHLKGKLFDFASVLSSVPLRFYIADLSENVDGKALQRDLEQSLLWKFQQEIDTEFPLLNSRNAKSKKELSLFKKGWDYPLQKERGRAAGTTNWLIKANDLTSWKGAL